MTVSVVQGFLKAVALTAVAVDALKLFELPADLPTSIPLRCRVPLTQNITCEVESLIAPQKVLFGQVITGTHAEAYCTPTCRQSLKQFQTAVSSGCGHTLYKIFPNQTEAFSLKELVDDFVWAQNLLCLQDGDEYCLPALFKGEKEDCSVCSLKYGAIMQESEQGRRRFPEDDFKSLLSSCSVPASSYPYSFTPGAPTTTDEAPTSTIALPECEGTIYVVRDGDTCNSIAKAQSMSTDRLVEVNSMDYMCTGLHTGQRLCIQDTCELITVQKNQTCKDLVAGRGFTTVELISWNPTLKGVCDTRLTPNLDSLEGRHYCIQPPNAVTPFPTAEPTPTRTTTTRHWTTTFFDEWTEGVEIPENEAPALVTQVPFYDKTYTPPAKTITPNATLASIMAEYTQYCWLDGRDFANDYKPEDYPAACQSLYEKYCVYNPDIPPPTSLSRVPAVCTPNRATYLDDLIFVPTPTPIQEGVTEACTKFYKVEEGDTCQSVATKHQISLSDLYTWNPAVGTQCQGLQLGVWVCVAYDPRLEGY